MHIFSSCRETLGIGLKPIQLDYSKSALTIKKLPVGMS